MKFRVHLLQFLRKFTTVSLQVSLNYIFAFIILILEHSLHQYTETRLCVCVCVDCAITLKHDSFTHRQAKQPFNISICCVWFSQIFCGLCANVMYHCHLLHLDSQDSVRVSAVLRKHFLLTRKTPATTLASENLNCSVKLDSDRSLITHITDTREQQLS